MPGVIRYGGKIGNPNQEMETEYGDFSSGDKIPSQWGDDVNASLDDRISKTDSSAQQIDSALTVVGALTIQSLAGVLKAASGIVSGGATTSDLSEGSNLYYTTARFDTRFGTKSTTNLSEGSNLYYTNSRADARIPIHSSVTEKAKWVADNSAVTRYYSVDAIEVAKAERPDGTRDWSYNETSRYATASIASFYNYLGIHLPHGATVTALRVTGQRVTGADLTTWLAGHTRSGTTYTIMATVVQGTSMSEVSDTSIIGVCNPINNDLYGYSLRFYIDNSGTKYIRGIQIDYTVVRPQP